jgi:hypothetical protein
MVTSADPAQFESECFDQPAELSEPDVPNVATKETLPQIVSAGAGHNQFG